MATTLRTMPELPIARFSRYVAAGISADDARTLIGSRALADFFDQTCELHGRVSKTVANWVLSELLGALNGSAVDITDSPMPPARLAELIAMIEDGTISGKIGKEVFAESYKTGASPREIVETKDLKQISDEPALWEIIDRVVTANAKQATDYANGKDGLFGFFVGQVMKQTGGRANPVMTNDLLHKRLGR
jgi:aspartyl-tRNA(Asn)/glutamyl-tRNA(Gln) amidotransferase subunit B